MLWIRKASKRLIETKWKTLGLMVIASLIGYSVSLEIGIPGFENQDKVAMIVSDWLSFISFVILILIAIVILLKVISVVYHKVHSTIY